MEISPNIQQIDLNLTDVTLNDVCIPFDFTNPQHDPIWLSNQLTLLREKHKGIGLAANQVGLNVRVISIKGLDSAMFNPKIVDKSEAEDTLEEGCLSFPGLVVKVKRPVHVRVRFTDALGQTQTKQFTGMTARCIQHEIDHLDGILFFNRANKFHRDQGMRRWKKIKRNKSGQ